MPGKFEIDFPLFEKITSEVGNASPTNPSFWLPNKINAVEKAYIEQAKLESGIEVTYFTEALKGLVLASRIIGFNFALHALKRLQEECGHIKCFDSKSYDLGGDDYGLHEKPITSEKLAAFLVAYQLDCFKFKDHEPRLIKDKAEFREGVNELIASKVKEGPRDDKDIFKETAPTKNRRPSFNG